VLCQYYELAGDAEHAGGGSSLTLSSALISAREGTVETQAIRGKPGKENKLKEAERFLRLSALERTVVIQSELTEGVSFDADGTTVTVKTTDKNGAQCPVAAITRPATADFQQDVSLVATYSDLRSERLEEIHLQIEDLVSFFGVATPLHPGTYAWTLEMLDGAVEFATMVAQRVKLSLGAPRPELFTPLLQPIIQTPSHGSFPSGHATQAFVIATLLDTLRSGGATPKTPSKKLQFYPIATRIAMNRTVAGVHYPSDSAAGAALGVSMARLVCNRLVNANSQTYGYDFQGQNYHDETTDGDRLPRNFHVDEMAKMFGGADPSMADLPLYEATTAPNFSALWKKAKAEWKGVWG